MFCADYLRGDALVTLRSSTAQRLDELCHEAQASEFRAEIDAILSYKRALGA